MRKELVKAIVDRAYCELERACDPSNEATKLLRDAYAAAEQGERSHRRMGRGFGGYRASVQTAARYFVCKWFCDPAKVTSAREACSLRGDCLNASALRELLDTDGHCVAMEEILSLDYKRDLVADERVPAASRAIPEL
jgi:hypothetical protein